MSEICAYRTAGRASEPRASRASSSVAMGSSNSEQKKAKSSRVSSIVARPTSVSMNGGSSIGGAAGDASRDALRNDELTMGRNDANASHEASPAFVNACKKVLLPAFWSPSSRNV